MKKFTLILSILSCFSAGGALADAGGLRIAGPATVTVNNLSTGNVFITYRIVRE